jgi:hypothetical protein
MENVVVSDRSIVEPEPKNGGARLLWRKILPTAIAILVILLIVLMVLGAYVGYHVRHNPLASLAASIGCASSIYFLFMSIKSPAMGMDHAAFDMDHNERSIRACTHCFNCRFFHLTAVLRIGLATETFGGRRSAW